MKTGNWIVRGARRVAAGLLAAALVTYAGATVSAWLYAEERIFLPPVPGYDAAALPVTVLPHPDGGSLALLHLPNPSARYTLLYSHGNGSDIGRIERTLRNLHAAGFSVLAYDYRGYGLSDGGPPTTRKALADIAAAYRHATGPLGVEPERLVLYGFSVGAGPSIWLAGREPAAALIVEGAFVSAYRVVHPWLLLPFDRFPNERRIGDVRCPVLVIHGEHDRTIPLWHGKALFAAAAEPKRAYWVPNASHNDVPGTAGETYYRTLREFLE